MGGPSTDKETTVSPRNNNSPNVLFSSLSSFSFPFVTILRNSSASPRTMFMCLSNAMNFPTITLPSCTVTLTRQLMNRNILLDFDADIFFFFFKKRLGLNNLRVGRMMMMMVILDG